MKVLVPCAALLLVASPLHAQTYKWVDDKGVTNYSNKAPRAKAQAQVVEERLSVIGDPDLPEAADRLRAREARREEREHIEWRTRQRAASAVPAMQTYASYDACAYVDCGYGGYFYPAYFGGHRRHFRGKVPPRPVHHHRSAPLSGMRGAPLR